MAIGFPVIFLLPLADRDERAPIMVELTRLNGTRILLNSDLLKTVEASPDTMLTLISGEKLIVREKLGDVLERVLAYRAILLATVAQKLSPIGAVVRAASLSSIQFEDILGSGELDAERRNEEPR
jgi:flagellar protein FlbD